MTRLIEALALLSADDLFPAIVLFDMTVLTGLMAVIVMVIVREARR